MDHKKFTMRNALLVFCITSVVFALLLQTFLFHQTLRRQIRAESMKDFLSARQEDAGFEIRRILWQRSSPLGIRNKQKAICLNFVGVGSGSEYACQD